MNEPKLRFPEFTDDWKQHKLGELGSLKNGMNFSKEAMGIGFPFVNLQNIFGNNVVDVSNLGKAMASDSQLKDYNLIHGDVLFVRSSVKLEGVGEAAVIPCTLKDTTYSGFIIRFRDEYGLDNDFKRFVFGIESVRNQIMSQATNSANKNISQPVLENLKLAIPSKLEQQKLGVLFSNLDTLIQSAEKELDGYRELKQGMLQKMFPKKGETTPEIRFPEFTGDWEQRKLDEISAKYKNSIVDGPFGSDLKTADYTDAGVLVMQSNYITSGNFDIKQPYYVSEEKAKRLARCHCKGGDILIAKIGANFGICNIIPKNIEDAVLSSNCMKVDLDDEHDNNFYKQYFNILYESGYYYSLVGITAQPALSLKFIKSLVVPSPSFEEQKKIGEYFSNLDNLITLQQKEIDGYKELKKGLLQQMFC